jgi:hypothetical protein
MQAPLPMDTFLCAMPWEAMRDALPALALSLPAQWRQALELTNDVTVEASDRE